MGGTWFVERWQPSMSPPRSRATASRSTQSPPGRRSARPLAGSLLSGAAPVPFEEAFDFERGLFEIIAAARRIEFGKPLDTQPVADLDVSFEELPRRRSAFARPRTSTSPPGPASSSAATRPRSPRSTSWPGWPASTTAPGRGTRRSRTSSARARAASSTRSSRMPGRTSGCRRRSAGSAGRARGQRHDAVAVRSFRGRGGRGGASEHVA